MRCNQMVLEKFWPLHLLNLINMKILAIALLCLSTAFLNADDTLNESESNTNEADTLELEQMLGDISSFEANFVQQRYSSNRGLEESTSGKFLLKRPNQFLWQTFTPFAQTIISNGEALWTIDDDLEQVIINPMDDEIQNAPILLLARDQANLKELFTIEKQVIEEGDFFILRPLDSSGNFERLRIGFEDNVLSILELYDSLGQLTRITMTNSRQNPVVDLSTFIAKIPEDYDVIDSRPLETSDSD